MVKVLYNGCHGGFSISQEALSMYNERSETKMKSVHQCRNMRTNPILIDVIEELEERANGDCAHICIKDISDEYATCYTINEYDGLESVVCEPSKLVYQKLSKLNIDNMTGSEALRILKELKELTV